MSRRDKSKPKSKSGPTPFGFRRQNGKIIHDPVEAPVLQRLFELFLQEQRKKPVAGILNAENAKTRSGGAWSGQTVGRQLTNELALGIPGELEPLVSSQTFETVQNILTLQKGRAKRKPSHLFAGLTVCHCGGKMYVPSGSHKYVCRVCKAKIHKQDLEAVFIDQIKAHYSNQTGSENLLKLLDRWSILNDADKRAILESTTEQIKIERNLVTLSLVALYKT